MSEPSNDEILRRLRAQTLRVLEEAERRSEVQPHRSDSVVDRPWFPWVSVSCAIAVGAALALTFR